MTKRFIEFMTQNSDDGNLNCGFKDIRTEEWYHTKDRVNAKKCVDILNQLNDENEQLKQRNNNQYNQLNQLWQIIEAKDWETLTEMDNQMKEDDKQLRNEWRCYE